MKVTWIPTNMTITYEIYIYFSFNIKSIIIFTETYTLPSMHVFLFVKGLLNEPSFKMADIVVDNIIFYKSLNGNMC